MDLEMLWRKKMKERTVATVQSTHLTVAALPGLLMLRVRVVTALALRHCGGLDLENNKQIATENSHTKSIIYRYLQFLQANDLVNTSNWCLPYVCGYLKSELNLRRKTLPPVSKTQLLSTICVTPKTSNFNRPIWEKWIKRPVSQKTERSVKAHV